MGEIWGDMAARAAAEEELMTHDLASELQRYLPYISPHLPR
jgi:hypothetical protein